MRAAVQRAIGRMEICEEPAPTAGAGELVVAVRAALTCGTDRKLLERGHAKLSPPLVMGHEFSGVVVESGEGSGFAVGEAVMSGVSGPCGACSACVSGAGNRCENPALVWGAFAELVRVPAAVVSRNVFRKPENLSFEMAALLDPLACVVRGMDRLSPSPNEPLLIVGAGAIGLLWVAAARRAGVGDVRLSGRGEQRLDLARRWGARIVSPGEAARSATAVVECVGTPEAWETAFAAATPGGRVLFFGGCAPGSRVWLDAARIHYGEVSCLGSYHYTPIEAARAREWLSDMAGDLEALISEEGTLSDLPGFFERMRAGDGIKFVVRP